MLQIENRIKACFDGKIKKRSIEKINRVFVHRIDKLGETAVEICTRFQTDPDIAKYTGGENPYTFFVSRNGTVEQACPIVEKTSHARRFNQQGLGVAVIGDFRFESPTQEQWLSAVELCALICLWKDVRIFGHTEVPGASKDPNKDCPGRMFNMNGFRHDVFLLQQTLREKALFDAGAIF